MNQRLQRQLAVGEGVGVAGNALIGLDIDQDQRPGSNTPNAFFTGARAARRQRAP